MNVVATSSARKSFAGISPTRYQHLGDKQAMLAVRSAAGIDDLVRLYNAHFAERAARVENLSSNIRIGDRQMPDLYRAFRGCCERLGTPCIPELFLCGHDNAWTSGSEEGYVVLGYPLLRRTRTVAEVEFIIGHELGHLLAEHVLYHSVAFWALRSLQSIPMVGTLLSNGLVGRLSAWIRCAEYTADRAGLLACQDVDAAGKLLVKLAGFPSSIVNDFDIPSVVDQAVALEAEFAHPSSRSTRASMEAPLSHPWPIVRIGEMYRWQQSHEYTSLLKEAIAPTAATASPILHPASDAREPCEVCRHPIPVADRFCSKCGAPGRRTGPAHGRSS